MAKKNDWNIVVGRAFAERIAIDYGFDDDARKKLRSRFDSALLDAIGIGMLKGTRFENMDSLRYDMDRVLSWKYSGAAGWRKAEGLGKEGRKGPKQATPDMDDLVKYIAIERLWGGIETNKSYLVAIGKTLMTLAESIREVQSDRGDEDILDRGKLDLAKVECLRFLFCYKSLLLPGLNPTRGFLDHIKLNVGIHFLKEPDKLLISKLQNLGSVWYEPWALLGLSLPYPWIVWGYYENEAIYEEQ